MTSTTPNPVTSTDAPTPGAATDAAVKAAIVAAVADPSDVTPYAALTDAKARARVRDGVAAHAQRIVAEGPVTAGAMVAAGSTMEEAFTFVSTEYARVMAVHAALPTGAKVSAPIDHTALLARRVAVLRSAADALESRTIVPDGSPMVTGDLPAYEVTDADMTDVYALASAKVASVRSAPTNDVGAAIVAAFDAHESGHFLTVAQIRNHWVANGGPAKADGRITARLFPRDKHGAPRPCTVAGIVPGYRTDGDASTTAGARKA